MNIKRHSASAPDLVAAVSSELTPAERRIAEEVTTHLQGIPRTSEVKVTGGRQRTVLLGRFPAQDLPPRPDFMEQAARWLG